MHADAHNAMMRSSMMDRGDAWLCPDELGSDTTQIGRHISEFQQPPSPARTARAPLLSQPIIGIYTLICRAPLSSCIYKLTSGLATSPQRLVSNTSLMLSWRLLTCSSSYAGVRLGPIMCRTLPKVRVNLNLVVCITEHLSLMQQRRLSGRLPASPSGFWLGWRSLITKCEFTETAELRIRYNYIISEFPDRLQDINCKNRTHCFF